MLESRNGKDRWCVDGVGHRLERELGVRRTPKVKVKP